VFDFRKFKGDVWKKVDWPNARTPQENKETHDAYVLAKYFGLSVFIQDPGDGKGPSGSTADYSVGILRHMINPLSFLGSELVMEYATPMDNLYPDAGTSAKRVDKRVQEKATQAPVVVVDISQNKDLQQMYNDGTLDDWGNNAVSPRRQSVPLRVIIIYNNDVVGDYGNWGPDPVGIA
jgi:hypothetical protein